VRRHHGGAKDAASSRRELTQSLQHMAVGMERLGGAAPASKRRLRTTSELRQWTARSGEVAVGMALRCRGQEPTGSFTPGVHSTRRDHRPAQPMGGEELSETDRQAPQERNFQNLNKPYSQSIAPIQ
jgi:hypothetical protein